MQRLNENFKSIEQMTSQLLQQGKREKAPSKDSELTFQSVLSDTRKQQTESVENLRFSKHANERLAMRNINLSQRQIERLENGTTKAREKGIQESLVMVDNLAFIVNVKNNTVITAVGDSTDSIFTNIDGAVIS